MSEKYPGGFVTYNPPTPSQTSATGIWTLSQQEQYQQAGLWPNSPSQVSRSLRFNSADSAFLYRTPASASNQTTWTWSGWVKRSGLGAEQVLFSAGLVSPEKRCEVYFTTGDALILYTNSGNGSPDGNVAKQITTTQVFRDPSAWYHIVAAVDTTQATASNRLKLYVNGAEVTSFSSSAYPSQNHVTAANSTTIHYLGRWVGPTIYYYNGYMANVQFVDGQALTPTSFGEYNVNTGVWQPLQKNLTYGTNGFQLTFNDNTNTTATTLGADSSGNGNNWTPSNFSVTTGPNNDSMVDSPTSYGTDTGVGGEVRGNYATLNPLNISGTLANGNLDYTGPTGLAIAPSTIGMTSGKWYFEMTATSTGVGCGLSTGSASLTQYLGQNASGWSYFTDGLKYTNNSGSSYGATFTTNDVIGVAFDADAGTLTFYKNGTSQGTAFSSLTSGPYFFTVSDGSSPEQRTCTTNFGQRAFAYTAPSGFKALCTQNLPTPTIGATTATLANKYFDVVLRNGAAPSGGTFSTNVNMASGAFLWEKPRNNAYNNSLFDSVRGISKYLTSNSTAAEGTEVNWMTAFGTNSYTTGSSDWASSVTVVDWIWAANGSGSTNTAGSITSTVSANTTSGISVVTYTGTGTSGQTVGHGLGVKPAFIIVKKRSTTGGWVCWQQALTGGSEQDRYIYLDLNSASGTTTNYWGTSGITSTTFGVWASGGDNNASGATFVAYCFAAVAGYSAFGSYTGNGSADGPFIYTGFRPAFVMVKNTASGESWLMFDSVRNTYNVTNNKLAANSSVAENDASIGNSTQNNFDFLSNGFKAVTTNSGTNGSSAVIIYMAFASNPFKYSLAR